MFDTEDSGPQLWLNEIMVTKSIGFREYQKHNYQTAALYFQRVLDVAKDDYEIRIMLSKCQQNTFQPFLAHQNHLLALKKSLTHLMVMENEARMLCDNHDEFEFSLIQYLNGARKRVQPPTFTLGTLKVFGIVDNATKLGKQKYNKSCLGNSVSKLAKENKFKHVPNEIPKVTKDNSPSNYYSLYLDRLNQERKYFLNMLNYCDSKSSGPFSLRDKKMKNYMNCMVVAFGVATDQLYSRKRFYIHECEVGVMKEERNNNRNIYIVKDMRQLQIAKYLNTIVQQIIYKKIKEAKQMTSLLIHFTEKINYNSKVILEFIYQCFGFAQYLLFQNMVELNEEQNFQRMLILLGANKQMNCIPLMESVFGPFDSNGKVTINKLQSRIKKSKCIMEKIYLNFEMAKCHLQLGSDDVMIARNKGRDCLELAKQINSHTWVANTLILLSTIEFRLNNKIYCLKGLTKAIDIARTLFVTGVEIFLKKVSGIIFEVDAVVISRQDKKQAEILSFMPDITSKMEAMCTFRRLNTMPVNRQMSLARGATLKHNKTKYTKAQAAHKYLSIVPGSQTSRLGIPKFLQKKRVKINVKIPTDT